MKNRFLRGLLAAAALTTQLPVMADDIELFAGLGASGDAPNVMLVLDNAANFSANVTSMRCSITAAGVVKTDGTGTAPTALDQSAGAVEQCALYAAIQALEASGVAKLNIGVMGFNATGMKQFNPLSNTFSAGCVNGTGGCLLMPLTELNDTTKPLILEWIRNWAISGGSDFNIKGNNSANGAAMQETWAYYFGKTGVSGRNYSYPDIAPAASCAKKYTIFIGNAYRNNATPGDGTNEDESPLKPLNGSSVDAAKRAAPAATAAQLASITGTIPTYCGTGVLQTSEGKGAYALNWARYMKAQDIITYSIGVLGPTCNAEYAAHLTRLGAVDVGGGKFFGTTNFNELKTAIETSLSEIQSVNSAFASVSLPVSVNTQGTYLNQVYVGMFRPAQNFVPRWQGNLKQYRMGIYNGELKLLDAQGTGSPAISSSGSGFIAECARSYWTPTADDAYWGSTFADANCSPHPASSNTPDGNIVEKGAQAYTLRGAPDATSISRNIKTCNADCTDLVTFDSASGISKTDLGNAGMTDAERTNLLNWARGLNNKGDEAFVSSTAMRPSSHGDVVHSRPVAINFGTDAAPEVVVFYGGNDGVLRAINGNRDGGASIGLAGPGSELWSFVPTEFYGKFKRLRDNNLPISYPGSGVSTEQAKDYGFDGPITAYKVSAGRAWIYASMRRGGRALYAFDVDMASPGAPTLKWKKSYTDADFAGLGQTWSSPKVIKSAYDNGAAPILIVGGGYDPCEDTETGTANHSCTTTSSGNHIYVLNADDGTRHTTLTLPKSLGTEPNRGVVGDITVVNDPVTGWAKYAYAADLGGNIYRINIGTAAPADWTITKIASLGCEDAGTCAANRKFMFAPDVVEDNGAYVLLIGSGDREKPLNAYTVTKGVSNYFFMVKDKPSDPTWLSSESLNCSASVICKASLTAISSNPSASTLAASKGWYLEMRATEQVVTSAITLYGVVTFSSHMPVVNSPNSCASTLGTASVYNINYLDASSANGTADRFQTIVGGGLPPSPVAGMVTLDSTTVTNADGTTETVPGQTVPFVIGANPNSPLESELGGGGGSVTSSLPKVRTYWYIQQ